MLAAHLECYFVSHKSKVTSYGFIWFWILCSVWSRICYNRLIAKSIIDYPILTSINKISIEIQFCSIMLIWGICYLLGKFYYSKSYIRTWANHWIHQRSDYLLVLLTEIGVVLLIIGCKHIVQWQGSTCWIDHYIEAC